MREDWNDLNKQVQRKSARIIELMNQNHELTISNNSLIQEVARLLKENDLLKQSQIECSTCKHRNHDNRN